MGVVQSPFGARSAPPQPFGRSNEGTAAARLPRRLLVLRTDLNRRLRVLRLRTRLLFGGLAWPRPAEGYATRAFDWIGQAIEAISWKTARAAIRAIEWRRVALVASEPFVLPTEFRAAMVRILAYICGLGALSLLAAGLFSEPRSMALMEPAPRPAWIEVEKPWPAFQQDIPGFSESETQYAIRRHAEGGGRKDILSFGELGRTQRFMSFEIYRAGRELAEFGRPADDVRALASEYGRVSRMHTTLPIPSKFGKLQTFEFAIGPFSSYNCIGFIRSFDAPRVQITGLSCNMNLLVDRSAISCGLDRLTLMSAGSDPEIARLFAQAELRRNFCGARDHLLYATPKRPGGDVTQLTAAKPRLRGRIAR